jgi:predicted MFS family arabinose efflux permease
MWAPSWTWVLVGNALLGVSQGLTWSMTVLMKIDLAGAERRGLATGSPGWPPSSKGEAHDT